MKKTLLLLASAALLLVGCQKEQIAGQLEGGLQEVSFTANLAAEGTKAVADGDGAAASVNRCIMEIYYGDELFARQIAQVTNKQATFSAQVPSNRTYTVAFWADCVADATSETGLAADKYYTTTSLKAIALNGSYVGNDDKRDAFFVCKPCKVEQGGTAFTAELKRPFAQVNVITTDWDKVATVAALAPEKVNVTLKNALVAFNAVTGEASGSETITYTADVYTPAAHSAEKTLSMDYLFASAEKAAIDIDWKAQKTGDDDVEHAFAAVPYQRNYRTNIKGALLTAQGQWTVTVDSDWDGDGSTVEGEGDPYLVNYFEAGSIAAANEALKTKNAVSIQNPSDLGTAIVIPAEQDGKSVLIKISGASTGDIAVKKAVNGPASLAIESDSKTLDIDLPNSHVDVNKGVNYTSITAKTGDNTLVIGKDVKAAKLTTTKGAVVVNGQVEELSSNVVAQFNISTAEGLMTYAAALNAGKYTAHYANLVADIDMTGKEWVPMSASNSSLREFDGEEHTISNLTTTTGETKYYGLFLSASFDIKNVTVKDAVLTYPSNANDQARAGVIVGWLFSGNVTNCHVDGAVIKASQKIGGIVGNVEASTTNPMTISDCSVKNLTVSSNCNDLVYQAAGIAGYIQQVSSLNITIKNCSVENITVNDPFTGSNNISWHNHSFIGNIENTKENTVIALENNTVDAQLPVERTAYTTDYFGWAGNAEKGSNYKAVITIDGEAWTPNYPVKNVTKGTSYPTVAKAIAAASAGDKITLEEGEYTLPEMSNVTIEGLGDNVVVNHASGQICKTTNVTLKNIVFNLGQNGYHGFQHASNLVLDGCTFNGFQTTYGSTTYKNCTFNQDTYAYNMNAYGAEIVCDNCTFNGKGKAVYVYNEGSGDNMYHISFNGCTFNEAVGDREGCKAAILVKENLNNQKYVVNINGCEANFDKYVPDDPDYTGSSLWNMELKDGVTGTDVTVNLNDEKVYPFTSFKVNDADGLRRAVKLFNKGKENTEYTIELADGTYSVSDLHVKQADGENKNPRSLLIKATNKGKAVLTPNADTKTRMIFIVSGCSNYYGSEYITFDGLKFSMTTDPNAASHAIYCPREPAKDEIGKLLGEEVSRYAHNINVINCELQGFGTANNSLLNAPQAAGINHVTVDGCVVNNAGYVVNGYFVDTKVLNSKVTNVKACANTNSQGITVENCEISAWNDYCIRSNGGPIIVKNNKFDMTFNGAIKVDEPAAIVYLRGANAPVEATISGNTITKAKAEMWDCYCATAWTVNGEAKAAGTGINF